MCYSFVFYNKWPNYTEIVQNPMVTYHQNCLLYIRGIKIRGWRKNEVAGGMDRNEGKIR